MLYIYESRAHIHHFYNILSNSSSLFKQKFYLNKDTYRLLAPLEKRA